jgi:hypothetical protein
MLSSHRLGTVSYRCRSVRHKSISGGGIEEGGDVVFRVDFVVRKLGALVLETSERTLVKREVRKKRKDLLKSEFSFPSRSEGWLQRRQLK